MDSRRVVKSTDSLCQGCGRYTTMRCKICQRPVCIRCSIGRKCYICMDKDSDYYGTKKKK